MSTHTYSPVRTNSDVTDAQIRLIKRTASKAHGAKYGNDLLELCLRSLTKRQASEIIEELERRILEPGIVAYEQNRITIAEELDRR
jgi:hypothetical protein